MAVNTSGSDTGNLDNIFDLNSIFTARYARPLLEKYGV